MKSKTLSINLTRSAQGVTGTVNGQELDLRRSLAFVRHSPDGFEFGYGGSGPAQLAFAILYQGAGLDIAEAHYQQFKRDFVSAWKGNEVIQTIDLERWNPKLIPEEEP
jgi:hypothetical protein